MKFYDWGMKPQKKMRFTNTFRPMSLVPKRNPIPSRPNKNLSYPQARKKYGSALSPFGNWDKDMHINMFDCRPFNPLMHRVPEEYKDRKVKSYAKPGQTWSDVWDFVEDNIPHAFKKNREEEYSNMMKFALLDRERTFERAGDLPFKDVVGVYHRGKVRLDVDQTSLVQYYISRFLREVHPNKDFEFYEDDPSKVKVYDHERDMVYENRKVSGYFPKKTPPHIRNLLTLLAPYASVTIVITDDPGEVARKSAVVTSKDPYKLAYTSCETPARGLYDGGTTYGAHVGPYSDIRYGNAIAWFYMGKDIKNKCPVGRVMLRWGTKSGRWTDTKSIGIEYYPGRHQTPKDVDELWYRESRARGFYGSISAGLARALIGELQDILKEKGHYSHTIRTPYEYEGFSDLTFGSDRYITYTPIQRQRAQRSTDIRDIKWNYLQKDKLQKPFMYQFATDPDSAVRKELARRRDIDEPIKIKLAQDENIGVKLALLENPTTIPREAIDYMYSEGGETLLSNLMYRSETPFKMKRGIISRSTHHAVRLAQAGGESLDPETRQILLHHRNFKVRREFAKRQDLTDNEIQELLNDSSAYVLQNIIGNKLVKLTPEQFKKFIKSRHRMVKMKMARLKYISDEDLLELAKDSDDDVRDQVLRRTNIPPKTLEYILMNYPPYDLSYILRTKFIPRELIQKVIQRDNISLNDLFANENIPEDAKAIVVEKYMVDNNKVPYGLITDFGKYRNVMDVAMKILKSSNRPDMMTLNRIAQMRNIPREYRHDAFAMVYEYGNRDTKKYLLNNPTVNKEIKKIIMQGGGYY